MPTAIWRFSDFELDRSAYQLRRMGRPVQLERIPLDLLFLLAEKRGALVTREEILERIWGKDVFLETDHSINTAVRKIRHALHDDPETPRFVVTVTSKGYRFVAPLREPHRVKSHREAENTVRPQGSMVGRERELAELRVGLADASAGRGRLFLVSGEPGIGKTRLSVELAVLAQAEGMAVLTGHCLDHQEAVPYLPFVEILESCAEQASDENALRKLLAKEGPELARLMPRLRRAVPDLAPPLDLPPQQARRQLFNSYCGLVARLAIEQPTVLILEDLHWADDSTLSLLDHLVQRLSKLPLLVFATFRDAELDVSPGLAKELEDLLRGRLANHMRLKGLPRNEVAEMLTSLSGKSPPAAVVREIYDETEGNPFFVEELFLHLKEENRLYDATGGFRSELKIGELEAPRSVRLVVGRRLARLSDPTRKCMATAAVIGRFFSFEILQASSTAAADSLLECVAEAEKAGLICSSATGAKAQSEFSHELIRQVVIGRLPAPWRQRLHLEVAEAIEQVCGGELEDHVSELAYHYARSANTQKAVQYLTQAARWACSNSAYKEAEAHVRMTFSLIERMPKGERASHELPLQLLAGLIAAVLRGSSSSEVRDAAIRALELARSLGDYRTEFAAKNALFDHYTFAGDYSRSREMAEAMVAQADASGQPPLRVVAHQQLGQNLHFGADFEAAREHYEAAIAAYNSTLDHSDRGMRRGFAMAHTQLGQLLSRKGFLDQGIAMARRGVELARELTDAETLAWRLIDLAWVHQMRSEIDEILPAAEEAASLSEEYGLSDTLRWATIWRGWAMARKGQLTQNVELTNQGLDVLRMEDGRFWIAEIALRAGDAKAGLAALDVPKSSLRILAEGEEGLSKFLLPLFKGRLLTINEDETDMREGEKLLRYCLDWARKRQAKLHELEATYALARVMARTGRRDEARAMLDEIYNWFTEGFDTADLKDAKALLDELSRSS
jgi:predicted ATPase